MYGTHVLYTIVSQWERPAQGAMLLARTLVHYLRYSPLFEQHYRGASQVLVSQDVTGRVQAWSCQLQPVLPVQLHQCNIMLLLESKSLAR